MNNHKLHNYKKSIQEIVFLENIKFKDMVAFHQHASKQQSDRLERLLSQGRNKEAAKLMQTVIKSGDNFEKFRESAIAGDGGIGEDQDQIKIYMSHDPDFMGATMVNDYDGSELATTTLPSRSLKGFEPDSKMEDPKSAANVKKIIRGLKKGDRIPAILVRKLPSGYQVIDGHHRFWAQKKIGIHDIPVKIVPSKYIKDVKNKDEIPKEHLDEDQDLSQKTLAWQLVQDTVGVKLQRKEFGTG